jgi:protein-S-isoprenylcysteine O-methyltransferase Ste14
LRQAGADLAAAFVLDLHGQIDRLNAEIQAMRAEAKQAAAQLHVQAVECSALRATLQTMKPLSSTIEGLYTLILAVGPLVAGMGSLSEKGSVYERLLIPVGVLITVAAFFVRFWFPREKVNSPPPSAPTT